MSELKADKTFVFGEECFAYKKSEADNVIAEKDKEIAELKKQVQDYAQGLYVMQARREKEARHQKYKRCLAMARSCGISAQFEYYKVKRFDNPFYIKRAEWSNKWRDRWIKIAEQFKEAK